MALKLIAVNGATLKITTPGASANLSITTPPSTNDKIEGNGVLRGPITIAASNGSLGPCGTVSPAVGSAPIVPTATKNKSNGLAVIRKGDGVSITMVGTQPNPPGPPIPCNFSMDVEIDDPGQVSTRGQ